MREIIWRFKIQSRDILTIFPVFPWINHEAQLVLKEPPEGFQNTSLKISRPLLLKEFI